jgi:hypothetical protein
MGVIDVNRNSSFSISMSFCMMGETRRGEEESGLKIGAIVKQWKGQVL